MHRDIAVKTVKLVNEMTMMIPRQSRWIAVNCA